MNLPFLPLCAVLLVAPAFADPASSPSQEPYPMHVNGTFDVKVVPQQADNDQARTAGLQRLSLDKRFHGPLQAVGQGEMLAVGDGVQSGAYVALEKVSGELDGRRGSFVLMHSAVMNRGTPQDWVVKVVVDSGTDQLRGLSGEMRITIADGKHYYDFDYRLPDVAEE